ncbi:MAG: hypothetical protein WCL32_11255 [Planctomycetota bacterium]
MTGPETTSAALQAYLLGQVEFDAALLLQRRLHYDVTGNRDRAGLIVCEHPPLITVGRHGSHRHLRIDADDLVCRGWATRWVPRGGGYWLHLPGQIALYAVMPLDRLKLSIPEYLQRFGDVLRRVLDDFSVHQGTNVTEAGVCVGARPVATMGIAVRDDVTMFGACFNLCPDLELFRGIRVHPAAREPMTSLERERRGAVRPALVRERIIDHFAEMFGFQSVLPFSEHALLQQREPSRQSASA